MCLECSDEMPPLGCCIYIQDLSPKHRKALEAFVEKFRKGAIEHGDLPTNKNWTKDQISEVVDLSFYLLFELLEKEDAS